jgi:hypothetical protein
MLLLRLTSRSGQEYCVKSALARETGVKNHAPGRLSSLRRAIAQQSARPSRYPVPDVPSIAVLPFQSMSADGMVEDIITGLSRILRLFVIARNSRLTYKGQAVDVKRVGRELGVRYVLSNRMCYPTGLRPDQARCLRWVISGCAGPSAARQVNLKKRTPRTRSSRPKAP